MNGRWAAAAAVAVLLAGAGGVTLGASWGSGDEPTTAARQPATDSLSASGSPSAPSPSLTAASPSPSASPSADLAAFRFPEEADWAGQVAEETRVEKSSAVRAAWALAPCNDTTYPSDAGRRALRGLALSSLEYGETRQLVRYSSTVAARAALADMRRLLARCADERTLDADTVERWGTRPAQVGDEALLAWSSYLQDGQPIEGGTYAVALRRGELVYLVTISGEFDADPAGPVAQNALAAARRGLTEIDRL